ncbi:GNAT family N-acetyltransferase [Gorillibacterium sp. CAU 1737]|uniref:GNAT family N-acetyltransferase n=1 Tax=Gorillibacterium sp. CAU 1737 TaxID=3140362 RepID=UPI0032606AF4
MSFAIRTAVPDDLPLVAELWRKLSIDQLSKDPYYRGSFEFSSGEEQFYEALRNTDCRIFMAEENGAVIGFIEIWLYPGDFYFFADDYAYILHLYVEETERSFKTAFRLYKAAEEWAMEKGRRYLAADVFSHNQKVVKLLEHVGLSIYRTRLVKPLTGGDGEGHEAAD